ncbi:hypothetical protein [Bradyrhizobium sp. USDA 4353]
MSHELRSTSGSQLDVVLVIPETRDQARLAEALPNRHVQLVDDETSTQTGPVILAVAGRAGQTSIYINAKDDVSDARSGLTAIRPHLQDLLRGGWFEEGGMLVLGRDRPKTLNTARAYLPNLLSDLRTVSSGTRADELCRRGLSSLRRDRPSAATALLWWELARAKTDQSPHAASAALSLAANEFRRAAITSHAGRADSLARRMERRSQLDLFRSVDTLKVPEIRYEVVPVTYARATLTNSPICPMMATSRRWQHLGYLDLDPSAIDHASLIGAEIVLGSAGLRSIGEDRIELEICLDLAPRRALGLGISSHSQRLNYSLSCREASFAPYTQVARAGEPVKFELQEFRSSKLKLTLTATDDYGQLSHVSVELHLRQGGGVFDASFRLRGTRG